MQYYMICRPPAGTLTIWAAQDMDHAQREWALVRDIVMSCATELAPAAGTSAPATGRRTKRAAEAPPADQTASKQHRVGAAASKAAEGAAKASAPQRSSGRIAAAAAAAAGAAAAGAAPVKPDATAEAPKTPGASKAKAAASRETCTAARTRTRGAAARNAPRKASAPEQQPPECIKPSPACCVALFPALDAAAAGPLGAAPTSHMPPLGAAGHAVQALDCDDSLSDMAFCEDFFPFNDATGSQLEALLLDNVWLAAVRPSAAFLTAGAPLGASTPLEEGLDAQYCNGAGLTAAPLEMDAACPFGGSQGDALPLGAGACCFSQGYGYSASQAECPALAFSQLGGSQFES